jgi:hypothetical protein
MSGAQRIFWLFLWVLITLGSSASVAKPTIDFNGDGYADISLQNIFTGEASAWLIGSSGVLKSVSYGVVSPSTGKVLIGSDDFNGDGRTDLLWYNTFTGELGIWLVNGGSVIKTGTLPKLSPSDGWGPVAIGDFNGDGKADVLWRNAYTAELVVYLINGVSVFKSASIGAKSQSEGWVPLTLSDFNGDGKVDVLWRNVYTGEMFVWLMSGTSIAQSGSLGIVSPNSGWMPIGVNDINKDGKADVLWSNVNTGALNVWFTGVKSVLLGSLTPNSGWAVVGVADFNGDGYKDLLFNNSSTGGVAVWFLNGSGFLQSVLIGTVPTTSGWMMASLNDFNGDGRTDILWRNLYSNATNAWIMSSTPKVQSYNTVPASSVWQIRQ